jgi:anaerobic sulfite reductase subunit A
VTIPANLDASVAKAGMGEEYDGRCIDCGRCNFVCPTGTCNSMQDIYYRENGKAGERRRVWASCMVDGFTDVAGGGSYRRKNGERMRFKTLHKVLDYRQRFGENMCVGCGRCDDACPEYISFSHIINRLEAAMEEVSGNGGK